MKGKTGQNWYLLGLTAIALGLLISIFPARRRADSTPEETVTESDSLPESNAKGRPVRFISSFVSH